MFSMEHKEEGHRDLHQVRPQLCRHDSRARLSHSADAQGMVEGVRVNGEDPHARTAGCSKALGGAEAKGGRALPRAWQGLARTMRMLGYPDGSQKGIQRHACQPLICHIRLSCTKNCSKLKQGEAFLGI
jgi:hypothetical protein